MSTPTTSTTSTGPAAHSSGPPEPPATIRGAWLLVMNREIVARALNRTFLVGIAVSLVLLAAVAAFIGWQGSRTEVHTVAVISADTTAVAAVETATTLAAQEYANIEVGVLEVPDEAAARNALESGDADAWLRPDDLGWTLAGLGEPDASLTRLVAAGVEQEVVSVNAAAVGTSVAELTAGAELSTEQLEPGAIQPEVLFLASFAMGLLFFLGAMGSGFMIASSVVEEKQSRLVEIMATAVPLRQLLAGKILGNSVIALAQTLLFASVGLIAVAFTPVASALPALSTSLIWFVAFFTVGFLALAALYAVAGALASRAEDVQHTSTPMTMVIVAVYFVAFSASGTFATVLSYVPITSVVTMPVRVLAGEAAWWEPVISLVILAAFAGAAVLVCERAYRGALLQTGGRLSWRQAMRAPA
jgi:ABC-2 type transport system permease protein